MKFSVLDLSPIDKGKTANEALYESIKLARLAEELGYYRYWVSEHHNMKHLAGSSPEVLISSIAAQTEKIRVGSGGVMLPHYSAYKVAENFRVLETLYPGRIDLGVGRAPGGTPNVTRALQDVAMRSINEYPDQVKDLTAYLRGEVPSGLDVRATPLGETAPDVWLLGSSGGSAALAASLGMPFMFAHFINGYGGADITRAYQDQFMPSEKDEEPVSCVAIFVICAETEEKAEKMRPSHIGRERMILGNPTQVKEQLEQLAEDYRVDEIMVNTITGDYEARIESYWMIAEMFLSANSR